MLLYRSLVRFLQLLARLFYRQIEVVGREQIPADGPVIFAGNHPNSLHDPMLIIAFAGRPVAFAAKDVLFKNRLVRFFLTNLGAVPIARKSDHGGDSVDNQQAFDALFAILAQGRAMGIFPEGLSHDEAQLSRLKTGAARIALGVLARHPDLVVRIVPCGLTYVTPKRFRSRVLLQFGPPLSIDKSSLQKAQVNEREAVQTLTRDLEREIRGLTVNAEDWETVRVLDGVRRLYQPPEVTLEQRTELARRFNEVYPKVKDQPEVKVIFDRVAAYLDRLREVGLEDRDLRRSVGPFEITARVIAHVVLIFIWLPLALPGIPIFVPLLLAIRLAGPRVSPRRDVIATTKLVLGMVSTLLLIGGITAWVAWVRGPIGGVVIGTLLLLAFPATLRVLERGTALRKIAGTMLKLLTLRRAIAALRTERSELERIVGAAVDRYRPEGMKPLFPAEPPLLEASDNLQ